MFNCPKCNASHYCGCKSCKDRKGLDKRRSYKFMNGDFVKCAYCREVFHCDFWERYSMKILNQTELDNIRIKGYKYVL